MFSITRSRHRDSIVWYASICRSTCSPKPRPHTRMEYIRRVSAISGFLDFQFLDPLTLHYPIPCSDLVDLHHPGNVQTCLPWVMPKRGKVFKSTKWICQYVSGHRCHISFTLCLCYFPKICGTSPLASTGLLLVVQKMASLKEQLYTHLLRG